MCTYVCVSACMYTSGCVCKHVCVWMGGFVRFCMYMYMHVCVYMCGCGCVAGNVWVGECS